VHNDVENEWERKVEKCLIRRTGLRAEI